MTDSSAIRSAWATYIFADTSITALTDKSYSWDLASVADQSAAHDALTRYSQSINFFQYRVLKSRNFGLTNQSEVIFETTVQYYKEATLAGSAYNAIEDAFETIADLVESALGETWASTVNFYRCQEGPPTIELIEIGGVPVWMGEYKFFGHTIEAI